MKKVILVFLLVCCIIAATGCTGLMGNPASSPAQRDGYSSGTNSQGLALEKSAASYPAAVPVPAGGAKGADWAGSIETKIIRTAQVTLEVKDVPAAVEGLKALAVQRGGYLSSSNMQAGYTGRLSATIVMRIPQSAFESVLESVKAGGTVKSVSTQGEDVTEQYVDLTAQKTSYQNQLVQYNEIMKKAVKVEDVIAVQEQIDRVQTELNRLEGRIRYLDSRIDLSTITVTLQEPEPVGGSSSHDFVAAINEGINGFFGMIDAIIILFFMLLPLIILGGAGYAVYRWRKNRKTAGSPSLPETGDKK